MKEIEFRGKKKNPYGDNWVKGYYALLDGEHVIIMPHSTSYEKALKENKSIPKTSVNHVIDINTLGQYTGVKDKNGNKIFEGDIVKIDEDVAKLFCIESLISIVKYFFGTFICTNKDNYTDVCRSLIVLTDIDGVFRGEVIGNIYDNPELIKDKI